MTGGSHHPARTSTVVLGDVADVSAASDDVVDLDVLVDELIRSHAGVRPDQGAGAPGFVAVFDKASDAIDFAAELQLRSRHSGAARPRIGINTGDIDLAEFSGIAGPAIRRCIRVRNLGHPGQTLLSQVTASIVSDELSDGMYVRDLGSHQLRDLARPEHIHQLCSPDLAEEFPPLHGTGGRSSGLPTHRDSLVGRVHELSELSTLVDGHRLVTVTGAGGCGKTRLVLELATDLCDAFADGVWWVDLAPVHNPARVTIAVALALGIQQSARADAAEVLVDAVGESSMFIVLDNCEHVIDEAAAVARSLLDRCPNVRLAVTSREPLAIAGEALYRVPSMACPRTDADPSEIEKSEAAALFVERARRVSPTFTLAGQEDAVAEICRRLDGIPLAIELAAARIRMMTPGQVVAGLEDRFRLLTGGDRSALPRQRTLEGSVEWSVGLLPPDARRVLARLSVFNGSFALDSAEAVCGGEGVEPRHVLDLMSMLVDRSLVHSEPSSASEHRYRLLETIRVYARERLVQSDESAVIRDRHLSHFCGLAQRAAADAPGRDRLQAANRFGIEQDNLRAAMEWGASAGRADDVLAIASVQLWLVVGLYEEMRERITTSLPGCASDALRARALTCLASCSMLAGDEDGSLDRAREAVEVARRSDSPASLSLSLAWLGWAEAWVGVPSSTARDHLVEAEEIARELELPSAMVNALYMRGQLEALQEDLADGIDRIEQALEVSARDAVPEGMACYVFVAAHQLMAGRFDDAARNLGAARQIGDALRIPAFVALSTSQLGLVDAYRGRLGEARRELAAGIALARRHGVASHVQMARSWIGIVDYIAGDDEAACATLRSIADEPGETGVRYNELYSLSFLALAEVRIGDLDAARTTVERSRSLTSAHCFPTLEARCEVAAARLALADRDPDEAARCAHRAIELSHAIGAVTAVIEALETLALVEATTDVEWSVRLVGATESARVAIGWPRFAGDEAVWGDLCLALRESAGDEFESLRSDGEALSLDGAVATARRGRGRHRRSKIGWPSLTPTELRVVDEVARGLTNKQVASNLFMSVNTVKTHLSHVFDKLGVFTRSELTAAALRRPDGGPP